MATSEDNITRARTKKLDAIDEINRICYLVKAARMAATGDATPSDWGDPIVTLLDVIRDGLSACADALEAPEGAGT